MDAGHLLWEDRTLYQRRFEKSAAALVAVARAVEQNPRPADADDFVALYEVLAAADAEHFSRVWRDPVAYHWVRRAVQLLASRRGAPLSRFDRAYCAALGAANPDDALAVHLRAFARFVLGLGLVAGRDVALATSYDTMLPLALPGTELAITGAGRVSVGGVTDGAIDVVHGGDRIRLRSEAASPADGPRLVRCPTVTVGEARVVLNPHVFQLPGLGMPRDLTVTDGAEPQANLAEALRILQRFHPLAFMHFASAIGVVALKEVGEGDFGTLSNSELPGAFVCSLPSDPYALAADFIHELYHNRLFAIEETGAFFEADGEDAIEGELHYSPWRDALRPLHGLLHAVYVYLPVYRFWSDSYRANVHEGVRRDHVRDQLARVPAQLRIGVNQLRRHARFTALGAALFEEIAREASRTEDEAAELGATLDAAAVSLRASGVFQAVHERGRPLSVGETLLAHLRRCDVRGECTEEAAFLEAGLARPPR